MRRLAVALAALAVVGSSGTAFAEVPYMLTYQGYLTDAVGNPVTGDWTITFGLFDVPKDGSPFFEETVDTSAALGLFAATLGGSANNPLDPEMLKGGDVWVELTVETELGPVVLSPRQQVVSNPFALHASSAEACGTAADAGSLGGKAPAAYVTYDKVGEVCVTPDTLETLLLSLGFSPGAGYSDEDVAAFLLANGYSPCACYSDAQVGAYLAANGFKPGPYFSGKYSDLAGAPDLSKHLTQENVIQFLAVSGAVLMADGSVALTGDLNFSGNEAVRLAVQNAAKAPTGPTSGQLWFDTSVKQLKIFDGDQWTAIGAGAVAGDVSCPECVDASDVAFTFAAANAKGGSAIGLACSACVDATEVTFPWAKGVLPGGDAEHALTAGTADTALTASTAKDVACAGCVQAADLDPAALDSKLVKFDDAKAKLGSTNVQGALDKVAASLVGGTGFQEGNGTIVPYTQQWGMPAYGKAAEYIHLMNPTQPKILAYLYATESSSFATSNNLVVAYNLAPNKYSTIATAKKGETAMTVGDSGIFNYGNHVLLHQTVGTGGSGTNAGKWEINQVVGVNGNTVLLAKPLDNDYSSGNCDNGRAQAVVAASYNLLEIVGGGNVYPSVNFANQFDRGGIVFIRSRKLVVKSGGKIHADGYGFRGGNDQQCPGFSEKGGSECNVCDNNQYQGAPNCSGGGGGSENCWYPSKGGGGGGNKAAGKAGTGSQPGQGGTAKGDANATTFQLGGGGGAAVWGSGGNGGGLVVIGAETIIVEAGGTISANGAAGGSDGTYSGGGGGAGGTVAIYAKEVINSGTISATGGNGGTGPQGNGGAGGDGWNYQFSPIAGVVNESYPKGVEIWVDNAQVTATLGDPNSKGAPAWDAANKKWGKDGLSSWDTGPLDLTNVASWTLGEHKVELRETGGAGGELKLYMYVIYPFTKSTGPSNDSCAAPATLDLAAPVTVSGTTEDVMGKIKAADDVLAAFCGGSGGPDVVYTFTLDDWRQLTINVVSAFTPRTYIRKDKCADGTLMGCGEASWTSNVLAPGTYFLFVDSDGNLQKGNFTLKVTPAPPGPPPNDTCSAPAQLLFQGGQAQANDMTLFANNNYSAACGGATAPDLVYQFEVPVNTSNLAVSLNADFAPVLYIAKGTCTSPPIACTPSSSYNMAWPTPGTYFLFVDGKTVNDKGLVTVNLTLTIQ